MEDQNSEGRMVKIKRETMLHQLYIYIYIYIYQLAPNYDCGHEKSAFGVCISVFHPHGLTKK